MHAPRSKFLLPLSLVFCLGLTASAQQAGTAKSVAVNQSVERNSAVHDPLGTARGTNIACHNGGIQGASCYSVTISCPDVRQFTGFIKVNHPAGSTIGTVIFTTGGNGTELYETEYVYGGTAINDLLAAGYTVAQVTWGLPFATQPDGWQTGPGGIRAAACRYATMAKWIYSNIRPGKAAPFCATGNSAGGEVIGQALAHYGLGSIFTMVEPTSGPPFARQDWACDCIRPGAENSCGVFQGYCVGSDNAKQFIDPAYSGPICSHEVATHDTTYDATFLRDSIMASDGQMSYPNTFVKFLYGALDTTGAAPNQGRIWENAITSSKASQCIADAPHNMADVLDGAQQIANDIMTYCKAPVKP